MMSSEIDTYKIQRPLNGEGPALAYNQDREDMIFMPVNDLLHVLFGEAPKLYAKCERTGDNLRILEVLPNQGF